MSDENPSDEERRERFRQKVLAKQAPREAEPMPPPRPPRPTATAKPGSPLTPRERQVLDLWIAGTTTDAGVAAALSIAPDTAKSHAGAIRVKLEATSRTHAVALALAPKAEREPPRSPPLRRFRRGCPWRTVARPLVVRRAV